MHVLVRNSAEDFLNYSLKNNKTKEPSNFVGFFYSEKEEKYVMFDKNFNIEYFDSVTNCIKNLKNFK